VGLDRDLNASLNILATGRQCLTPAEKLPLSYGRVVTADDFVGIAVRPAVTVCIIFFGLPPVAERWPVGACEQKGR
jgi:hypothetical protein